MYEQLYAENRGLIFFWVRRYATVCAICPAVDADDLAQAGFIGLVQASQSFQEGRAEWSTWASNYIRQAMRDALGLRRRRNACMVSLDAPVGESDGESLIDLLADERIPSADAALLRQELARTVREAVAALESHAVRRAVQCYYLEGGSRTDAARAAGCGVNQVYHLLRKGKQQLRRSGKIRSVADSLDEGTRFYAHKGLTAFERDRTSVVEAAVLWREEQRARAQSGAQPTP